MSNKIKGEIIKAIADRAPNAVREEVIIEDLKKYEESAVKNCLKDLVKEESMVADSHTITDVNITVTTYKLPSYENIPIRTSIEMNGIEIPRLIDMDKARAEDTNLLIETLSKYSHSLERRFSEIHKEEMGRYWANVITLFGLFLAVFSLIITSVNKIAVDTAWGIKRTFFFNLAQVLPVAIVLFSFIVVLKFLFRKR